MNTTQKLAQLGQSIWYDNIQRSLLDDGTLAGMIAREEIRGVTSNPTIFMNAITKTGDYDAELLPLLAAGHSATDAFWQLAVADIRAAADLFRPLYEATGGGDGYVSLEVNPTLAEDTAATLAEARALWRRVNRPNLMVKIPATRAGIPAITAAIAEGININVTLIFARERYAEVMDAYLAGLEPVSYTHLRAHETVLDLVCRLLLEKKTNNMRIDLTTNPCRYQHSGLPTTLHTSSAYHTHDHKPQ